MMNLEDIPKEKLLYIVFKKKKEKKLSPDD